jgi:hypothetical protein
MRTQESVYGILIGLFLIGIVFLVSSFYYYQYNPRFIEVTGSVFTLADLGNYLKAMIGAKVSEGARDASYTILCSGFDMDFSCPCSKTTSCPAAKQMYEKLFVTDVADFISSFQIFSKNNKIYYPYNISFSFIGGKIEGGITQSCSEIMSGASDESFSVYVKNITIDIEDSSGNNYKILAPIGADIINNRMWFLYRKVKSWIEAGGGTCLLSCDPNSCAKSLQDYINDPYVTCTGTLVENNGPCVVKDNSCCSPNGYRVCVISVNCTDYKYYQYIHGKNIPLSIIVSGTLYASLETYHDTCVEEYKCECVNNVITSCTLIKKYAELCTCENINTVLQ